MGGSAFVVVVVAFVVVEVVVAVVREVLVEEVDTAAESDVFFVFLPPQPVRSITAAITGNIYLSFILFLSGILIFVKTISYYNIITQTAAIVKETA